MNVKISFCNIQKGQCHEIFNSGFFIQTAFLVQIFPCLEAISHLSNIRGVIRLHKGFPGSRIS